MRIKFDLKIILLVFAFLMILTNCKGQNSQYKNKLRPKVKAKLDSLYPNATSNILESDSIQRLDVNCHCSETVGMIILIFDTNGNFRSKEVHYYGSLNGLPDTILNYIKKNESPTVKFNKLNMTKNINSKGEISYGIIEEYSPEPWYFKEYMLRFKPSGELISKEEMPLAQK